MYRLLYRSDFLDADGSIGDDAMVDQIVAHAQASNAGFALTGALLYLDGVFVQALEGPVGSLEVVFERICRDLRHRNLQLVEHLRVEERMFPEWTMARIGPTSAAGSGVALVRNGATTELDLSALSNPSDAVRRMRRALLEGTDLVEDGAIAPSTG